MYLVRKTKGTKDFLKLRTAEADKMRCGQKHFEEIGVPFAVAVSADDVQQPAAVPAQSYPQVGTGYSKICFRLVFASFYNN